MMQEALLSPDLDYPRYFMIETVRGCNSKCPFCFLATGKNMTTGVMEKQLYDKIVRELCDNAGKITRVTLYGVGEPLLDKRIRERVAWLKRAGILETVLATNAALLDDDMARGLLESGLDLIRFSVSSIIPEKYGVLRPGLDFDTVMSNIHGYIALRNELKPHSRIDVSMERHEILTDANVADWKRYWEPHLNLGDRIILSDLYDFSLPDDTGVSAVVDTTPCEALLQTMVIGYDGTVHLCCHDFYNGVARFPVGDVANTALGDIWRGEKFARYRSWHRSGQRRQMPICNGCTQWKQGSRHHYNPH